MPNNKSKNILYLIFLPLLILFSSFTYSDVRDELADSKSCGTYENTNIVKMFSWEICEQDFTYRMFFKLMPTIMEEYAVPLTNATNIKKISTLESNKLDIYLTNEYSIINITKSIISLSITFGSVIFVWNFLLAFLRTSTEGKFLGEGYTWQKNLIKYGVILIMLLPVGNGLIVINIVVVCLILFAIAFGNSIFSVYLNFFDVSDEAVAVSSNYDDLTNIFKDDKESKELYLDIKLNDSAYHSASQYIESLYKMQICKKVTENFIIETAQPKLKKLYASDKDEYKKLLNCIVRPNNVSINETYYTNQKNVSLETNGYENNTPFNRAYAGSTNLKYGSGKARFISSIDFGYDRNDPACRKFEEVQSYECGSLSVAPINTNESNVIRLINKTKMINYYKKATAKVESLYNSKNVKEIETEINTIWNEYLLKLIEEIGDKVDGKYSLSGHDETVIKSISYYFHQQLINDVYMGRALGDDSKVSPITNGKGSFYKTISMLDSESSKLMESYCSSDIVKSNEANNFIKDLKNGEKKDSDKSSFCLNLKSGDIVPFSKNRDENSNSILEKGIEIDSKLNSKINDNLSDLTMNIYSDLTAIERSFYKSLRSIKTSTLTSEMRKLGFVSSGSLGLKLIKGNDVDTKYLTAIRSSVGFTDKTDQKLIGRESVSDFLNTKSPLELTSFPSIALKFSDSMIFIKSSRMDLRQKNLRSLTTNLVSRNAATSLSDDDSLSTLLNMASSPLDSFKKALGYESGVSMNLETMRNCMFDMNKCPIPVENPIIAITDFGNELVSTASGLIATTIIVVFADFIKTKSAALSLRYKKATDVASISDKKVVASISDSKVIRKIADWSSNLVSAASFILKIIFPLFIVMLSMGMFFAYIIPLIPFLMFNFSYIAWITMSLTVYFIAPLWLVMNLKMEQDNNTSNNMYRSGYNMIMQVLFRPAILVLAMSIGWGLFNSSFLVLNLTIMPYIIGVSEVSEKSFIIGTIINGLMIIVIYAMISIILIKYIFNITYSLVNKMFDAMNVENINDQQGNITDDVMKSALVSSVVGSKGLGGMSGYLDSVSASGKGALDEAKLSDKVDEALDNKQYQEGMGGADSLGDGVDKSTKDSGKESAADSLTGKTPDAGDKSSKGEDSGKGESDSIIPNASTGQASTALDTASDNINQEVQSSTKKDEE